MKFNWKNIKVLVTGASGVIGQELLHILVKNEAKILAVDRYLPKAKSKSIKWIKMDLSSAKTERLNAFEPNVIFHLAASFERSKESKKFWKKNWQDNMAASHKIVSLAKSQSVKTFVFASSYLIYNPKLYMFKKSHSTVKLKEADGVSPRNITGSAKYYTEHELDFIHEYINLKLKVINARIFRVYGKGSKDVISRWIRSVLMGKEIKAYGLKNCFDYVYAGDVAKGLIKLAESEHAKGVVNLGYGRSTKVTSVLKLIKSLLKNEKVKIKRVKGDQEHEFSGADISKLKKLTGWKAEVSLNEGIRKVIEFEKRK